VIDPPSLDKMGNWIGGLVLSTMAAKGDMTGSGTRRISGCGKGMLDHRSGGC
jgi:hypothetical protein